MGAAHFLMKTLPRVASEMVLHVSPFSNLQFSSKVGFDQSHFPNQILHALQFAPSSS
jgi:hypothetical protein